jgi:hypothetical protein
MSTKKASKKIVDTAKAQEAEKLEKARVAHAKSLLECQENLRKGIKNLEEAIAYKEERIKELDKELSEVSEWEPGGPQWITSSMLSGIYAQSLVIDEPLGNNLWKWPSSSAIKVTVG